MEKIFEITFYFLLFLFLVIVKYRKNLPSTPAASQSVSVKKLGVRSGRQQPGKRKFTRKFLEPVSPSSWRDHSRTPAKTTPVRREVVNSIPSEWTVCRTPPPPPPPPSEANSDDYISNLRFLESLDFYQEEYYGDSVLMTPLGVWDDPYLESPNEVPEIDPDHLRRMSYTKKSVTNGEVIIRIGGYDICQFFVNGIEYHYVVDGDVMEWEMPKEIREVCKLWYLHCPKHMRKKFDLVNPPSVAPSSLNENEPPTFNVQNTVYF